MTRQESYIAELSQLLFYMTAWDKAEVLKGITAMINHPETGLQTMEELGNPMKLAVTLHRQYTPTPEPTPEELARRAALAEVSDETAELIAIAEEAVEEAEEESLAEEIAEVVEEPAEEPAEEVTEEVTAEVAEAVEEEAAEAFEEDAAAEAVEEAPAQEEAEEIIEAEAAEAPAEEAVAEVQEEAVEADEDDEPSEEVRQTLSLKFEEKVGQEKIFAEIFTAATEAQSAVPFAAEAEKETVRKARYWFLIPYIAIAVVIGVPATLIFALANVAVCAVSLVSLAAVVYLVLFQLLTVAVFTSKLIILGLSLLMLAITILLWVMTSWFLRTATLGFPRFLIEIARKYGYREVEVQ